MLGDKGEMIPMNNEHEWGNDKAYHVSTFLEKTNPLGGEPGID